MTAEKNETFSYEEVLENSTLYFKGDNLAAQVFANKYALKNKEGEFLEKTPTDMHKRLAKEISRVELNYINTVSEREIFDLLDNFKYLVPQGGPMTGIGNDYQLSSLSNCFVIGNEEDSYGAIMRTDEEQVQLMKRRGGVGHDLSHIRPKGSPVMNSALTSTGVVPFMERYSNSTREVAQEGRRGALMLSVSIKHPDAEQFIDAKMDGTKVTGANVSVRIDHDFMKAIKSGSTYTQQYPINSTNPVYTKEIDAKKLWDKIIHNAWKSAEPGILFWDTINNESIPDCYADLGFKTVSTNPCGEIPLCPYDSCRLLAINLYSYVINPFTDKAYFDYDLFYKHSKLALRFMDDIIDLELEKIIAIENKIIQDTESDSTKKVELELWGKIKEKCIQGRRTGIGITAEGDMLAAMGLTYGTTKATLFATHIHEHLAINVYESSVQLAKERGAFPIYDFIREVGNPFLSRVINASLYKGFDLEVEMEQYGRRNIACLTIAPTGTTSIMTQTTSGIEPAFQVYYTRRTKVNPNDKNSRVDFIDETGDSWMENKVFHHKFITWYSIYVSIDYNSAKLLLEDMSKEGVDNLITKSPYYKATANDIDWKEKVNMQGAIQKWIDHSISVTVNIPNDATKELVNEIYMTGWEVGCKGITVYRDGCRSGVLITESSKKKSKSFDEHNAPKRPKKLEAKVVRFQNNYDTWIAFVGLLEDKPYEVFTFKTDKNMRVPTDTLGYIVKTKDGGKGRYDFIWEQDGKMKSIDHINTCVDMEYYNYGKLLSGILRHGMPIPYVVDIIGNLNFKEDHITTWRNGVLRAIKQFIKDGTESGDCPKCEGTLIYQEGCLICPACTYSKCGS